MTPESIARIAVLADAIKNLTYSDMIYVTGELNTQITTWGNSIINYADLLNETADSILEDLKND